LLKDELAEQRERNTPPPLTPRTKWTRRVPHPVLIGHAASLSQERNTHFITRTLPEVFKSMDLQQLMAAEDHSAVSLSHFTLSLSQPRLRCLKWLVQNGSPPERGLTLGEALCDTTAPRAAAGRGAPRAGRDAGARRLQGAIAEEIDRLFTGTNIENKVSSQAPALLCCRDTSRARQPARIERQGRTRADADDSCATLLMCLT
jgi:hypothetical protein